MIFVECDPDAVLVEILTDLRRRDIIHNFRGKGELCNRLKEKRWAKGLVDEDPGDPQPRYLETLDVKQEFADEGLRLLRDNSTGNTVVVLRPDLEGWTLRSAQLAKIDVASYNLPEERRKLHQVINLKLDEFRDLVTALREKKSRSLMTLRKLLETID